MLCLPIVHVFRTDARSSIARFALFAVQIGCYAGIYSDEQSAAQEEARKAPQILRVARFPATARLSDNRQWTLKNGVQLSGFVDDDKFDGWVSVVQPNAKDDKPRSVQVPLELFQDNDRAELQRGIPTPGAKARFDFLPTLAPKIDRWEGLSPESAANFTNIVAIENGKVFAKPRFLLAVDAQAIAEPQRSQLMSDYKQAGAGRNLHFERGLPFSLSARLIGETVDSLLMESIPSQTSKPSPLAEGARFRLPRYLFDGKLSQQMSEVLKEHPEWNQQLSVEEIAALPTARHARSDVIFSLPPTTADPGCFQSLPPGMSTRRPLYMLNCRDHYEYEKEVLCLTGETDDKVIHRKALLSLADSAHQRRNWTLKGAQRGSDLVLLGAMEEGFVFLLLQEPVYLPASRFNELDQDVLAIATRNDKGVWLRDVEMKDLFRNQLVLLDHTPRLLELHGFRDVDGVVKGSVPILKTPAGVEAILPRVHIDALVDARRSVELYRKYSPLEKEPAELASKIIADRSKVDEALPKLAERPIELKREPWVLNDNSNFMGALVGEFEGDFVFQDEVKAAIKHFLVQPEALDATARRRAEAMMPRLIQQDWSRILERTVDWQFYQIALHPSTQKLLYSKPVAIKSIDDDEVVLQQLDGQVEKVRFVDERALQRYALPLVAILKTATERKRVALADMPLWTLRDSEEELHARYVADAGDDVLLKDYNGVEFLLAKANLDAAGAKQLAELAQKQPSNKSSLSEDLDSLPRLWIGGDGLIGPGVFTRLLADDRFVIKRPDGEFLPLAMSSLTLRERQMAKARILRQNSQLPDDRSIDDQLAKGPAADQVIRQMPPLRNDLKQRLKGLSPWQHATWQSQPVALSASSVPLAVDRDAITIVERDKAGQWWLTDLTDGQRQLIAEKPPANLESGPWLYSGSDRVWWVADGQLKVRQTGGKADTLLREQSSPIIAADQSDDCEVLLIKRQDGSLERYRLDDSQLTQLLPVASVPEKPPIRVWSSRDGSASLTSTETMRLMHLFPTADDPKSTVSTIGTNLSLSVAAVNRHLALYGGEASLQLQAQVDEEGRRPGQWTLPIIARQFQFVELDGIPVLQTIGRPPEPFYGKEDWNFVVYTTMQGDRWRFAYQFIEGQLDKESVTAASGSKLLHKRKGQWVLSSRPAVVPEQPKNALVSLAQELLEAFDIGQIEAVSHYLNQSESLERGKFSGELAEQFHDGLIAAAFAFKKHLGGDRLQRTLDLANYLRRKFPKSQSAGLLLVGLLHAVAWDARGNGYANTVSEGGWKVYRQNMSQAQKIVFELLKDPNPFSGTYVAAADVAMSNGNALEDARKLALRVLSSSHAQNSHVHRTIALLLLPRWHGEPGMTENYLAKVAEQLGGETGKAVYASSVLGLSSVSSGRNPVTADLDLDWNRLQEGAKTFSKMRDDPEVIDMTIGLMVLQNQWERVEDLLRFRGAERIPPGSKNSASVRSALSQRLSTP